MYTCDSSGFAIAARTQSHLLISDDNCRNQIKRENFVFNVFDKTKAFRAGIRRSCFISSLALFSHGLKHLINAYLDFLILPF